MSVPRDSSGSSHYEMPREKQADILGMVLGSHCKVDPRETLGLS